MLSRYILTLSFLCLTVLSKSGPGKDDNGEHDDGDGADDDDCSNSQESCPLSMSSAIIPSTIISSTTETSSTVQSPTSPTSSASAMSPQTNNISLRGDSQCVSLMCISAVVNGSTVEYTLQSTGAESLGWMAMGFGQQMANTPMVILWLNSDSSVTLSQRQAPAEVMPTVVSSPPRIAALSPALTFVNGSQPQFGYSIPADSETTQDLIWAFGTVNPGSAAVDASIMQHILSGTLTLNLTRPIVTVNTSNSGSSIISGKPGSGPGPNSNSVNGHVKISLLGYQKIIIAHAIISSFGFLFILPTGVLLARYLRTFTSKWYKIHWIIQFGIAGFFIISGVLLGIFSVKSAGAPHFNDTHKKLGIVLFSLFTTQCAFGALIHFIKPNVNYRPLQNYLHALSGLAIIGLAFYQVRLGYRTEWRNSTGREEVPGAIDMIWFIWIVMLPVIYAIGLSLLKRQYRQEKIKRRPLDGYSHILDENEELMSLDRPEMREISRQ